MEHVKLSSLVNKNLPKEDVVLKAADEIAEAGGSPKAQIQAARKAAGRHLVYQPHQGAKERARRLKQLAKQEKK